MSVTPTILFGRFNAEKMMFWTYVPGTKPSVCGLTVVEVPLAPPGGATLNHGELCVSLHGTPVEVVTCILCGAGNTPPAIPVKVRLDGTVVICPLGVGVGVVGGGVAFGTVYDTTLEKEPSNPPVL
jgi:hypothetical protein